MTKRGDFFYHEYMEIASEKKQKPLPYIILICTVLLLVIVLGMYMVKSTTTTPQKSKKIVTQTCIHEKDVCLFLEKIGKQKEFYTGPMTATIVVSSSNKPTGQVVLQTDTKNNVYVTSSESGKMQGALLLVDATLYKKNVLQNTWQKQSDTNATAFMEFRQKVLATVKTQNTDITYTRVGNEPCGTLTCVTYTVSKPTINTGKETISFDTKNYLLRKITALTQNGVTTETSFSYTDVQLTPPAGI